MQKTIAHTTVFLLIDPQGVKKVRLRLGLCFGGRASGRSLPKCEGAIRFLLNSWFWMAWEILFYSPLQDMNLPNQTWHENDPRSSIVWEIKPKSWEVPFKNPQKLVISNGFMQVFVTKCLVWGGTEPLWATHWPAAPAIHWTSLYCLVWCLSGAGSFCKMCFIDSLPIKCNINMYIYIYVCVYMYKGACIICICLFFILFPRLWHGGIAWGLQKKYWHAWLNVPKGCWHLTVLRKGEENTASIALIPRCQQNMTKWQNSVTCWLVESYWY